MDKTIKWCMYFLRLYRDKGIFRKSDAKKLQSFMKGDGKSSSLDGYPKRRFFFRGRWYSMRLEVVTTMQIRMIGTSSISFLYRLAIWDLKDGGVIVLVYDVGKQAKVDVYGNFDLNLMEMDETPICNAYTVAMKKEGLVETFKSLDRKRKRLLKQKERQ